MVDELIKILELKRTELNFCMKSEYVKGQIDLIEELIKTKKITIKDVSKKELFKIKDIKTKVNPVSGDKFPRPARRPMSSILQNTRFPKLRNYAEALKEYLKK